LEYVAKADFNQRIEVYDSYLKHYCFGPARKLATKTGDRPADLGCWVPILMILSSIFEHWGTVVEGKDSGVKSGKYFEIGLIDLLPNSNPPMSLDSKRKVAKLLYSSVRCGLFHTFAIRKRILITDEPGSEALSVYFGDDKQVLAVKINPWLLIDTLETATATRITALLALGPDSEAGGRFNRTFDRWIDQP